MPQGDMSTKDLDPKCYFCRKPVSEEEYCSGCHQYICDSLECDRNLGLMGSHNVEDHQVEDE